MECQEQINIALCAFALAKQCGYDATADAILELVKEMKASKDARQIPDEKAISEMIKNR